MFSPLTLGKPLPKWQFAVPNGLKQESAVRTTINQLMRSNLLK
jgi:hypothetical protein